MLFLMFCCEKGKTLWEVDCSYSAKTDVPHP